MYFLGLKYMDAKYIFNTFKNTFIFSMGQSYVKNKVYRPRRSTSSAQFGLEP